MQGLFLMDIRQKVLFGLLPGMDSAWKTWFNCGFFRTFVSIISMALKQLMLFVPA